jgi:hypothetical protein
MGAGVVPLLLGAAILAMHGEVAAADNHTVRLKNGVALPLVSLGTGDSVNQTRTNLEVALAAGFRAVDTALIYFDQSGVAEAIKDEIGKYERREIFITTKVPGGGAGVDNYKSTLLDAKVNLALLDVEYVDLLLVHWSPLAGCGNCDAIREQWRVSHADELPHAWSASQLSLMTLPVSSPRARDRSPSTIGHGRHLLPQAGQGYWRF